MTLPTYTELLDKQNLEPFVEDHDFYQLILDHNSEDMIEIFESAIKGSGLKGPTNVYFHVPKGYPATLRWNDFFDYLVQELKSLGYPISRVLKKTSQTAFPLNLCFDFSEPSQVRIQEDLVEEDFNLGNDMIHEIYVVEDRLRGKTLEWGLFESHQLSDSDIFIQRYNPWLVMLNQFPGWTGSARKAKANLNFQGVNLKVKIFRSKGFTFLSVQQESCHEWFQLSVHVSLKDPESWKRKLNLLLNHQEVIKTVQYHATLF